MEFHNIDDSIQAIDMFLSTDSKKWNLQSHNFSKEDWQLLEDFEVVLEVCIFIWSQLLLPTFLLDSTQFSNVPV